MRLATHARDAQRAVNGHVRALGGYWAPLSAVARLAEEVGELASAVRRRRGRARASRGDSPSHAAGDGDEEAMLELADVYVISTCVANQYCADLTAAYAAHAAARGPADRDEDDADAVLRIAQLAGQVARVVNAYDGDKTPKPGEAVDTVEASVARLHAALFDFSSREPPTSPLTLDEAVGRVLAKSRERDAARFAAVYDPSMCGAADAFAARARLSPPAFAAGAKIWGAPAWDPSLSDQANATRAAPHLARFVKVAPREGLDAFVVHVPLALATDAERGARFAEALARAPRVPESAGDAPKLARNAADRWALVLDAGCALDVACEPAEAAAPPSSDVAAEVAACDGAFITVATRRGA